MSPNKIHRYKNYEDVPWEELEPGDIVSVGEKGQKTMYEIHNELPSAVGDSTTGYLDQEQRR